MNKVNDSLTNVDTDLLSQYDAIMDYLTEDVKKESDDPKKWEPLLTAINLKISA